jgi:membrane-associated phospholipid phosphatase
MLRSLVWLVLLVVLCGSAHTQVRYELSSLREGVLLGGGLGLALGGTMLSRDVQPYTADEVRALTANIPHFDRFATRHYSLAAEHFSDWMGISSLALPLLAFTGREGRSQAGTIGIMLLEGATWTVGVTNLTKAVSLRPRPYVFNEMAPMTEKTTQEARLSYFSGHVSMSAYTAFAGARIFADLYPDSRWKPVVWAAAALIPAGSAYGRMKSGRHYLSDVVSGYLIGAAIGYFTPRLHRGRR